MAQQRLRLRDPFPGVRRCREMNPEQLRSELLYFSSIARRRMCVASLETEGGAVLHFVRTKPIIRRHVVRTLSFGVRRRHRAATLDGSEAQGLPRRRWLVSDRRRAQLDRCLSRCTDRSRRAARFGLRPGARLCGRSRTSGVVARSGRILPSECGQRPGGRDRHVGRRSCISRQRSGCAEAVVDGNGETTNHGSRNRERAFVRNQGLDLTLGAMGRAREEPRAVRRGKYGCQHRDATQVDGTFVHARKKLRVLLRQACCGDSEIGGRLGKMQHLHTVREHRGAASPQIELPAVELGQVGDELRGTCPLPPQHAPHAKRQGAIADQGELCPETFNPAVLWWLLSCGGPRAHCGRGARSRDRADFTGRGLARCDRPGGRSTGRGRTVSRHVPYSRGRP